MMKFVLILLLMVLFWPKGGITEMPAPYQHVDQVLWVIDDLNNTVTHWQNLGFTQIIDLDTVSAELKKAGRTVKLKMAMANLGGAHITWIQPLDGKSVFQEFNAVYGNGAMGLVHRWENETALQNEIKRLADLRVDVKEEVNISTRKGNIRYIIMNTWREGKYYLGYTFGNDPAQLSLEGSRNLHDLQINQYAFAVRDEKPVSASWQRVGSPPFQINHPQLGRKHYYGQPVDHDLIQGWQRHGDIAYEWCIPVSTPIVYDDHIHKHGEGIHHLAFSVKDMDKVLADYRSKGYVNSMGGTWGEQGKPGSGRYEYIDLESAGGLTMELLWNFQE